MRLIFEFMKRFAVFVFLLMQSLFIAAQQPKKINENLEILQLSDKAYIHIGYLQTESFGKVACNSLVYINGNEAVIIDTPPDTSQSRSLLQWIREKFPDVKIKAVIVNHFHNDCLGGLAVFHEQGIPSYASERTLRLAAEDGATVPQHGFDKEQVLQIGGAKVVNRYFGEAHTKDNIVTWIPSEKILFGGCMVKAKGSSKGNLADANEKEWSKTVSKVKHAYDANIVVPGHGAYGDEGLLDYTIELFRK